MVLINDFILKSEKHLIYIDMSIDDAETLAGKLNEEIDFFGEDDNIVFADFLYYELCFIDNKLD